MLFRQVVLRTMPILRYDESAAQWHALERARLGAQGLMPPVADGQIAAFTRSHGPTLVPFDPADVRRLQYGRS